MTVILIYHASNKKANVIVPFFVKIFIAAGFCPTKKPPSGGKTQHYLSHVARQRNDMRYSSDMVLPNKNRRQAEHPPRQRLPHACCASAQRYAPKASPPGVRSDIAQPGGFCQGGGEGVDSRPQPSRRPQTRRAPAKRDRSVPKRDYSAGYPTVPAPAIGALTRMTSGSPAGR